MGSGNNALARQFSTASLLRFALPNIVMMVFMSLYTIVDGMFISRYVGTLALSAINMSFPLTSLELALGIMLGSGGSAVIARKLGEGRTEEARQDFTCIVTVTLITGAAFMAVCLVFLDPILAFLGTSEAQLPYCRPYTQILLSFAPAAFLQSIFQILFVTAGKPSLGLRVTVAGIISKYRTKTTRNNSLMAYVTLEDDTGTMETLVFARALGESGSYIRENSPVLVTGRISVRDEKEPQILCDALRPLSDLEGARREGEGHKKLYLKLSSQEDPLLRRVKLVLSMFPGDGQVVLYFEDTGKRMGAPCLVHPALVEEMQQLLGEGRVVVK